MDTSIPPNAAQSAEPERLVERLRAHRESEPGFQRDLFDFFDAEARYGHDDPMEDTVYEVERRGRKA